MTGADHGEISVRLVRKIRFDRNGCWIWTGRLNRDGYGQISMDGRQTTTHAASYETFREPVTPGLHLDHLCRVRACCNPDHLEPVTPRINTLRGDTGPARNKAKTHCPAGHKYAGDNLRVDKRGHRYCRACNRTTSRRSHAAKLARLASAGE